MSDSGHERDFSPSVSDPPLMASEVGAVTIQIFGMGGLQIDENSNTSTIWRVVDCETVVDACTMAQFLKPNMSKISRVVDCAIVVDACTIAQIANPDEIMDRQIFNWGEQRNYMLCAVALMHREGVRVDTTARVC